MSVICRGGPMNKELTKSHLVYSHTKGPRFAAKAPPQWFEPLAANSANQWRRKSTVERQRSNHYCSASIIVTW